MSAQFTLFFDGHLWVGVYEIDDGESVRAARVVFGKEPSAAELHEFVREHGAELVRRAHGAVPVVEKGADAGQAGGGAGKTNPKRAQRMAAKAMRERGVSTKAQEALKADMESRGEERASARRREQKRAADEAYARRRAKARQKHRGC